MTRTAAAAALLLGLALGLRPAPAGAHAMVEGTGSLYAGLLQPLLVPVGVLALVAVALLLGSSGRAACRAGLIGLAAGLATGLALGRSVPATYATPSLLTAAFVAAALVAAGLRLPAAAAALIAVLAGLAVGIDAQPEGGQLPQVLAASAATLLGATALALVVAGLALGREQGWPRIAVRVAGSWITACAILSFAWLATSTST